MNSSGSMSNIEMYRSPGCREPKRCRLCGEPLEFYGKGQGVSEHWQLTGAAMNSADSSLCSKCYRESLKG